jgi:hypothetical protein
MNRRGKSPGVRAVLLIGALAAAVTLSVAVHRLGESAAVERETALRALAQSLGFASLAVSADCTLVRSLTEGLAGCLGDVPGGYCTFTSCDIVARPDLRTDYDSRLSIVRVGE